LKHRNIIILLLTLVLALAYPASVHASPVTVLLAPSSQVVPQGTITTVAVTLTGAPPGIPAGTSGYDLNLTGFEHGATYTFSPTRVATAGGSGSSFLRIDTNSTALYCPGTYSYTVTATNATIPDSGSASGSITVAQAGPALSVTVATDKSTYRVGDNVIIRMTANRRANARLAVSGPSGPPSVFFYTFGSSGSATKTLTANAIGRYTVAFEADDFCSGSSRFATYFDVTPDTYDVSLSIDGVPSTLSIPLKVDSQDQGSIGGSETKKLTFKVDTSHTITVAQYVLGEVGVRYYEAQNTWTVQSAGSHAFIYETEYLLTVTTDPNGVAPINSTRWYSKDSTVEITRAPQTVSSSSGTQYVFVGWIVDGASRNGNPISLTMNKPHQVTAKYQIQAVVSATSTLTTSIAPSTSQSYTESASETTSSTNGSMILPPPPISSSLIFALIALGTVFSIILISAVAVLRLRAKGPHSTRLNGNQQSTYSTIPSQFQPTEQTSIGDLDQKLFDYISEHGGTISLSTASGELGVPIEEIKASIERLKRAGKITPQ
jgi:hypothetical protein